MVCGTLNLPAIVGWQVQNGWLIAPWWPKGQERFKTGRETEQSWTPRGLMAFSAASEEAGA